MLQPGYYGIPDLLKVGLMRSAKKPDPAADIIRTAIMAEFHRQELNAYKLAKKVEGTGVSRTTVYAFVNGDTTLSTAHASRIMTALGLSVSRPTK